MKTIELVADFHTKFGHLIAKDPQFPTIKDHAFRVEFMREELSECIAAITTGDLVSYADSLGDLQYVLDGWFLNAGLMDKKEAILAEIHRSNMTKSCKSWGEAQDTMAALKVKDMLPNTESLEDAFHIGQVGELYIVYRTKDHKVMKSINYQPPNLEPIIYGQG